jgi:hypothetical protein
MIVSHLQNGEYAEALELLDLVQEGYYRDALAGLHQMGYGGEPNFIKAAMDAAGFPCGPARLPTRPLPETVREKFRAWVSRVGEIA